MGKIIPEPPPSSLILWVSQTGSALIKVSCAALFCLRERGREGREGRVMHPAAVAGGSLSWLNRSASAGGLNEESYCYLTGDQDLSVSQYPKISDEIQDFTHVGNNVV